MRNMVLTAALTGLFLPAAVQAQPICAQTPSATVGSSVGSAVGGTAGQILGAISDAVISGRTSSTATCVS